MDTNNRKKKKRKNQRAVNSNGGGIPMDAAYNPNMGQQTGSSATAAAGGKWKNGFSYKARSLMNLHNNEAGRRVCCVKIMFNIIVITIIAIGPDWI